MAGCPSFNVDCNCGCGLDVADCGGQQCGSTPQPGCVKLELPVPEKSWHWYDYLSNYGWKNGWELKNPDGSTTKVLGLNPEWNVRSRAEHIEKGKGEALGFKMGVSPALVKDVPIVDGVKGTFLGGELDARLTTNEAGFKAMGYGAKFDLPLDFVPVIGKYFKVSGYVLAAGGKAVVDWENGKGTFGAAALIGRSVEVSWKNMAIDAVRGWFKASIQEYVLGVDVFVWMIDTDVEEDHNVIQLVSNCHMSRRVANSKSFFLATDTVMGLLSSSEDRFEKILDVSRRTVEIDLETDLVDRYVGMQLE